MTAAEHAADVEWLANLHRARVHALAEPSGMVLARPECPRGCSVCTITCALATMMIGEMEKALGLNLGASVH